MIQPFRVPFLRNVVADEDELRSTEGDQLMCVNRDVASIPAAEFCVSRSVIADEKFRKFRKRIRERLVKIFAVLFQWPPNYVSSCLL